MGDIEDGIGSAFVTENTGHLLSAQLPSTAENHVVTKSVFIIAAVNTVNALSGLVCLV